MSAPKKGVNAAGWFYSQPGFHSFPATTPAQDVPPTSAVPAPGEGHNLLRAVPPVPTPDSVLADARADLAISVADLYLCHGSDGFAELSLKLRAIAVRAMRAVHSLGELDEQASQSRSESEVAW